MSGEAEPTDDIESGVLDVLTEVVPGVDARALDRRVPIRDQAEIDSVDFLAFVLALERRFGVEVPPTTYPLFATIERATEQLKDLIRAKRA